MAHPRAPLIELSPQAHNQRKMAARPQKYGKHNRTTAFLVPLWDSPGEVNQLEDKHDDISKASPNTNTKLVESIEKLTISPPCASTCPAPTKLDPETTPTPADSNPSGKSTTRRTSRRTRNDISKSVIQPFDLDVNPLLKESHAQTTESYAEIKAFSDFADTLDKQFDIKKHADGSFGDVYKLFSRSSTKISSKNKLEQLGGGVLKIIPLCGKTGPGARKFSRVEDVLSEVKLLRRLDALHGFTRFRDVHVVQGCYPPSFAKAFHEYKTIGHQSETANPEKVFNARQLFAILDMDDAGSDLECLLEVNIFRVHDIFWACAIVLAYGEATVDFEARDMHIGNICIRPFIRNGSMDVPKRQIGGWPKDQVRHLGLTEIRVTLIDYTLSRARLKDGNIAFLDLKNKKFLYPPPGKEPETLQQLAYCQQRAVVRAASGGKREDWSRFVPKTNVVWLAYLLETLLHGLKGEIVEGSNEYCAKAQRDMREKLEGALGALKLSIKEDNSGINSAGELLQLARDRVWLNKPEVDWYTQQLESEA